MNRAQLNLDVSWTPTKAIHSQLVAMENIDIVDLCPSVMVVHVELYSMLDKYKKENPIKNVINNVDHKSNASDKDNGTNVYSQHKIDEEYVPAARTSVKIDLQYTPSIVTPLAKQQSDEYTPTYNGSDEIVKYTPTKIEKSQSDDSIASKSSQSKQIDLNRNDCVTKRIKSSPRKIQQELFGGSDEDEFDAEKRKIIESEITMKSSRKRPGFDKQNKLNPIESPDTMKKQSKLNSWLSKTRKPETTKGKETQTIEDIPRKRKLTSVHPAKEENSVEQNQKKAENQSNNMEKLKRLHARLDENIENKKKVKVL